MTWASDKMLGWDLEATGTDPLTVRPVSFCLADFDFGQPTKVRTGLINPEIPIPAEATEIHGISDADVQERGGDLKRSVNGMATKLVEVSVAGIPLVGMNLRFDLTCLDTCHRLLNDGVGLEDLGWNGLVIDVLVIDRAMDKFRRGKRNLTALCEHYGVEMKDAHTAGGDVIASFGVAQALANAFPDLAAMSIEELHANQVIWHRDWAEHFSEYQVSKGNPPLESREFYWPLMLSTDGLPDNPEFDVDPPPLSEQLVTQGECANLRVRLQEDHGITDRQDVLDIVSGLVGRTFGSTKELTRAEFVAVQEDLLVMKGTPGVAVLLSEAQEARGGTIPQTGSQSATGDDSAPSGAKYEPFEPVDIGDASNEIVKTTMKAVMTWKGEVVSEKLRELGIPRSGTVTDKKLRLYEACCRERAAGNAEVEAWFA